MTEDSLVSRVMVNTPSAVSPSSPAVGVTVSSAWLTSSLSSTVPSLSVSPLPGREKDTFLVAAL